MTLSNDKMSTTVQETTTSSSPPPPDAAPSEQPAQPLQSPDAKKVGSDGEDFSDTANETGTFEV